MTIKRQPAKATEAQKSRIREFAAINNEMVENYVCIETNYRTTSLDQMYSGEAVRLIKRLTHQVTIR